MNQSVWLFLIFPEDQNERGWAQHLHTFLKRAYFEKCANITSAEPRRALRKQRGHMLMMWGSFSPSLAGRAVVLFASPLLPSHGHRTQQSLFLLQLPEVRSCITGYCLCGHQGVFLLSHSALHCSHAFTTPTLSGTFRLSSNSCTTLLFFLLAQQVRTE